MVISDGNTDIDIKSYDTQNVYESVLALPDQCLHAWEDSNKVEVPDSYRNTDNIIMCGMGGSGLGARVIESLYFSQLKKPLVRLNDYNLPSYVDEKSLVFVSSYSGNTEETINNLNQALSAKAKIIVIGAGGKLIEMAKEHDLPYYLIKPTYNPSNQPRMAIGYSIVGQLVLASKAGLLDINIQTIENSVSVMKEIIAQNDINKCPDAVSITYARKMLNKFILYISSEHLLGAMHVVNNQLNENAKNLSAEYFIPELNHHLMEGLKHPVSNNINALIYFISSDSYSDRIKQRFAITEEVVGKNNIESLTFNTRSSEIYSQVFEVIQFGAFTNFYLSMLYKQDPAPIPWVDYFKEKLG